MTAEHAPRKEELTATEVAALAWAVKRAGESHAALPNGADELKAHIAKGKLARSALKKVRELKGQGL